jgi:signal transduction histidine kinase
VVHVAPPFWETFWCRGIAGITCLALVLASVRYINLRRMQREVARLKSQRIVEEDRLRIARDIHDDLGARISQISLLSATASDNLKNHQEVRAEFEKIYKISRDTISALYETVWAVNPENDNLEELGNYICQMVAKLGENASFQYRFIAQRLPRNVEVPSQIRHTISMAVKEAVHNTIKHASASLVTIQITFSMDVLTISVQDNGRGFETDSNRRGSGLDNMGQSLKKIGGTCSINSQVGGGTKVVLRLNICNRLGQHLRQ